MSLTLLESMVISCSLKPLLPLIEQWHLRGRQQHWSYIRGILPRVVCMRRMIRSIAGVSVSLTFEECHFPSLCQCPHIQPLLKDSCYMLEALNHIVSSSCSIESRRTSVFDGPAWLLVFDRIIRLPGVVTLTRGERRQGRRLWNKGAKREMPRDRTQMWR